jgi:phosphoribosylaminoimidazolecarboxamide formyltransferase/IMP cyclohydrolase
LDPGKSAAPGFSEQARARLEKRENVRLLEIPGDRPFEKHELRSVLGGLLRQTRDEGDPPEAPPWRVATERAPSEEELAGLRFAWRACQGVKSNAVVLARTQANTRFLVGVGGGQPNRVDCVSIAGERAGEKAEGSVMASDAFFPFPDGVEVAASLGVTAVVQPGGSIRDEAVIQAAQENGITMVFTGVRHFRH